MPTLVKEATKKDTSKKVEKPAKKGSLKALDTALKIAKQNNLDFSYLK